MHDHELETSILRQKKKDDGTKTNKVKTSTEGSVSRSVWTKMTTEPWGHVCSSHGLMPDVQSSPPAWSPDSKTHTLCHKHHIVIMLGYRGKSFQLAGTKDQYKPRPQLFKRFQIQKSHLFNPVIFNSDPGDTWLWFLLQHTWFKNYRMMD